MISENSLSCAANHRGLSYGDGLFETIIYKKGSIFYLDRHLIRLSKGMETLGMVADKTLDRDVMENQIQSLINVNGMNGKLVRIKLIVWRKNGGLFTPENNQVDIMIAVKEQVSPQLQNVEAELSEQVKLFPSIYSRFKTCNMLPYVLAGLEKQQRNITELVLLSYKGYVAECSSSNIFWIKDDVFYTPSLQTGCIEGIMRNIVIETLKKEGFNVKEVEAEPEELKDADFIFTSNVTGLRIINRFEGKTFTNNKFPLSLSSLIPSTML